MNELIKECYTEKVDKFRCCYWQTAFQTKVKKKRGAYLNNNKIAQLDCAYQYWKVVLNPDGGQN